jgi:hypothetical protein
MAPKQPPAAPDADPKPTETETPKQPPAAAAEPPTPPDFETHLYRDGKSQLFKGADVDAALKDGWHRTPQNAR